ncbi:MAG: tetratricopeptide repeat protein [Betaproteobacteria bacterium]|nr:MAG: tetratricopeptide repeat protein [Betaproteobacteria bacterium]
MRYPLLTSASAFTRSRTNPLSRGSAMPARAIPTGVFFSSCVNSGVTQRSDGSRPTSTTSAASRSLISIARCVVLRPADRDNHAMPRRHRRLPRKGDRSARPAAYFDIDAVASRHDGASRRAQAGTGRPTTLPRLRAGAPRSHRPAGRSRHHGRRAGAAESAARFRRGHASACRTSDMAHLGTFRQPEGGCVQQAIVTFTRIIELKPDFAEGWNKRATSYFLVGDLHKSLADCDEVMKRNPYHFGALSGYALIYTRLEYYDRALDYSRRALEVNPNLDGVRQNIDLLEGLVAQRRKQMI